MTRKHSSLRRFFRFVESHGGGNVRREALVEELGGGTDATLTLEALARARIASEGPVADALSCPELRRCALEVREVTPSTNSKKRLFVALCESDPRECETRDVALDAVRQTTLSIRDIAHLLREILELDASTKLPPVSATEPMRLGEQHVGPRGARDVFFYVRPRRAELELLIERCGRSTRPALVMLPTLDSLDVARRADHGPGAHVEIDALADLLAIHDGELAIAPRIRSVATPPAVKPHRANGAAMEDRVAEGRPPLTLVVDAPRTTQRMGLLANGKRLFLQDSRFALIIRLIAARANDPQGWATYHEAGIPKARGPVSKTCGDFAPFVPKGFRVIRIDRRGKCRLNPEVIVERVDWEMVLAHPLEAIRKIAKTMASK